MNENKQVESLLKNIQEGIRLYGVKELNEAITKTLYKKTDKGSEIEYILNMVCNDYNITKRNLIQSKKHGHIQKARQMCFCLLYFDIGLSLREIGNVFGKYVRSISVVIENYRKMNPEFKLDREFLELYKKYQENILIHIKEEKTK